MIVIITNIPHQKDGTPVKIEYFSSEDNSLWEEKWNSTTHTGIITPGAILEESDGRFRSIELNKSNIDSVFRLIKELFDEREIMKMIPDSVIEKICRKLSEIIKRIDRIDLIPDFFSSSTFIKQLYSSEPLLIAFNYLYKTFPNTKDYTSYRFFIDSIRLEQEDLIRDNFYALKNTELITNAIAKYGDDLKLGLTINEGIEISQATSDAFAQVSPSKTLHYSSYKAIKEAIGMHLTLKEIEAYENIRPSEEAKGDWVQAVFVACEEISLNSLTPKALVYAWKNRWIEKGDLKKICNPIDYNLLNYLRKVCDDDVLDLAIALLSCDNQLSEEQKEAILDFFRHDKDKYICLLNTSPKYFDESIFAELAKKDGKKSYTLMLESLSRINNNNLKISILQSVLTPKADSDALILPEWLNDWLITQGAFYAIDRQQIRDGRLLDRNGVLWYLGTYFPKSFVEAFTIYYDLLSNKSYGDLLEKYNTLSILDVGCGTGGDTVGLITAIILTNPKIKTIKIDAFDYCEESLKTLNTLIDYINKSIQSAVSIKFKSSCVHFKPETNDDGISFADFIKDKGKYDIIVSFKMINELIRHAKFRKEDVYHQFAICFYPHLSDIGTLLIEDVSMDDENYSKLMSQSIRMNRDVNFHIISPVPCAIKKAECTQSECYVQRNLSVNYESRYYHDDSLSSEKERRTIDTNITYRLLANQKVADAVVPLSLDFQYQKIYKREDSIATSTRDHFCGLDNAERRDAFTLTH